MAHMRMYRERDPQDGSPWPNGAVPEVVRRYRKRYRDISRLLDEDPEILLLVHADLDELYQSTPLRGNRARYTSDNLLRALVVHLIEGTDFVGTVVRIAESAFLHEFVRLGRRMVMDPSLLHRCFDAVRPETWRELNRVLQLNGIGVQPSGTARVGQEGGIRHNSNTVATLWVTDDRREERHDWGHELGAACVLAAALVLILASIVAALLGL